MEISVRAPVVVCATREKEASAVVWKELYKISAKMVTTLDAIETLFIHKPLTELMRQCDGVKQNKVITISR